MHYLGSHLKSTYQPYDPTRRHSELELPTDRYRREKSNKRLTAYVRNIANERLARDLEQIAFQNRVRRRMESQRPYKVDYLQTYEENIQRKPKTNNFMKEDYILLGKPEEKAVNAQIKKNSTHFAENEIENILHARASTMPLSQIATERQSITQTNSTITNPNTPSQSQNKAKNMKKENLYNITIVPEHKEQINIPASNKSLSERRSSLFENSSRRSTEETDQKKKNIPSHQIPPTQPFNLTDGNKTKNPYRLPPKQKKIFNQPQEQNKQRPSLNPEAQEKNVRQKFLSIQSPRFCLESSLKDNSDSKQVQEVTNEPRIPTILSLSHHKQFMRNRSTSRQGRKQFINLVSKVQE